MVNPKKYRDKRKRPIETSTGETFTLVKVSPFKLIELFKQAGVSFEDLDKKDSSERREAGLRLAEVLLPECILELAPAGGGDDDHLGLDELTDLQELLDILEAVLDSMGVREETLQEAEKFRHQPDSPDGGDRGADVPGLGDPDGAP